MAVAEVVMLAFNQALLKGRLAGMSAARRSLFAVSCVQRLFPLYAFYHENTGRGDADRLRAVLDGLWEAVTEPEGARDYRGVNYSSLAPGEETPWNSLNPLAENAVAAVAYACACRVDATPDNAVWAAVQGYEAADYIVHTAEEIDFAGPEAEAAILNSEVVQDELRRQLRDIVELQTRTDDPQQLVGLRSQFRKRASSEGASSLLAARRLRLEYGAHGSCWD